MHIAKIMCDDASPCDLSALPRTDKMDDFDRWSVELAETKNSITDTKSSVLNGVQAASWGKDTDMARLAPCRIS
jgi:hypothetical protein